MKTEDHNVKEVEIDIRKYLGVFTRRWWIILSTVFISVDLALFAAFFQKDEYESEAKLLFESGRQASSLIGLEDTPQEFRALTSRDDPLDTQVEILRSIPTAEKVINQLGLVNESGEDLKPKALLANLDIRGIPGTDVLKITYLSEDPELSVEIVDTVMKVFIKQNVKSNRSAAMSAQRFIENQLPATDAKVNQAEEALKIFKESYNIVDLDSESQRIVETITSIENDLTQLRSRYANLNSQSNNLQGRLELDPDQAYRSSAVSQSPAVAEVLERLNVAESELASERSRYDNSHPVIIDLEEQVTSLRTLLNQRINDALDSNSLDVLPSSGNSQSIKQDLIEQSLNLDKELAGLTQEIEKLEASRVAYQRRAKVLPSLEKRYKDLERKFNAARITHEQLLENLQEAKVLQNQSIGNARVISPAQLPTKPVGFPKSFFLIGGGLIGIVLGAILAFLVDLADEIQSISNIQQLYEYPILGVIEGVDYRDSPQYDLVRSATDHLSSLLQSKNSKIYAELIASLKSRNKGRSVTTIGITSTVRKEGTSSVTADFAIALAQLNKSVLIIDANFSNPIQHHIFNISNHIGLSNLISSETPLQEAIQSVTSKLHILPSGPRRRQIKQLLRSNPQSSIIQSCQESYDYILIDTPAIHEKFSSLQIDFINQFLIVSQKERLQKGLINKSRKKLSKHPSKRILGLIINQPSYEFDFQSSHANFEDNNSSTTNEVAHLEIMPSQRS